MPGPPDPGVLALDEQVHASVPAFAAGTALLVAALALIDAARLTPAALVMASAQLGVVGAALLLFAAHRRGVLRASGAHLALVACFGLFLAVVALGAAVDPDPALILVSAFVPIVASAFLLRFAWLVPVLLATAAIQVFALDGLTSDWSDQTRITAALMTLAAPAVIQSVRRRTHARLHDALVEARESEARQRLLFDENPLPKWVYDDATLRILDVNEAAVRLYGYPRERFLQMRLLDLWTPEGAKRRLEERQHEDRTRVREFEAIHRTADGATLRVIVTAAPLAYDGRPALIATAQDVTARVRDQEALKASERRFQLIAKATKDAIWDWDLATDALWWSDNFYEIFGYAREDVSPDIQSWLSRVHPADLARVERSIKSAIERSEDRWDNEYRFQRADGTYATVFDRGYILHDEQGRSVRMLGSMQDVTALRTAEAAHRRQERLTALGTLVAGVAHEINNPLTYIQGNVELTQLAVDDLAEDPATPAALKETLAAMQAMQGKVLHGVDEIAKITRALKQVARSGEGPRGPVDLAALVSAVLEVTHARTKGDVDVVTELTATRRVAGNASELSQVLLNLIFNAADAVRGRDAPRIVVRSRDEGADVVIEVEDNGVGIPEDARSRIFTPFYTTKADGTGLGLSVSYSIARDHQGTLEFDSRVGVGTTFRLRLPALGAAPSGATTSAPSAIPTRT